MLQTLCAAAAIAAGSATSLAAIAFDMGIADDGLNGPGFVRNNDDSLLGSGGDVRFAVYDNASADSVTTFEARFDANFTLSNYQAIDLGGGQFLHAYSLEGQARFIDDATGQLLMTLDVDNAVFTSLGTADRLGQSSTIQGATDGGATVDYTWMGDDIASIGLTAGYLGSSATFAFGLTETPGFDDGLPGVSLGQNGYPDEFWYADTVFTGSVVPAPGVTAVLGVAGVLASRRRR